MSLSGGTYYWYGNVDMSKHFLSVIRKKYGGMCLTKYSATMKMDSITSSLITELFDLK